MRIKDNTEMQKPYGKMKIFAANANMALATEVARSLGQELGESSVTCFPDDEINMRINETVRGDDVFIIQPTSPPVNDNLMELLIMIDAMRRSSAGRITAVIPYFGYARQDRRAKSHDPISAKLVADLLTTAGADRILSIDLHSPQIQGFFNIPLDHLRATYLFSDYYRNGFKDMSDIVVVSPDLGSVSRCRDFAKQLSKADKFNSNPHKVSLAIVDKNRHDGSNTEVEHFIGDVKGKIAIMLDDVVTTGGSLCNAAAEVMKQGAKAVYACITHPVLVKDAVKKIENSVLQEVVFLDTVHVPPEKPHVKISPELTINSDFTGGPFLRDALNSSTAGQPTSPKIKILSSAKTIGDAIYCIHNSQSIGSLYKGYSD